MALTRPRTAKARKTLLQSYLIENFTSVNMLDRREDFKLEKSRIKGKKKKARSNTGKSFLDTKNPTSVEKICEAIVNTGYQPTIEEGHQSVKSGGSPVVAAEVTNDRTNDLSDEIKNIPKTTSEPDSSDKMPTDEAQKKSKKGKKNMAIRNLEPAAVENVSATTAAPISGYEKPLKTLEDGLLKLQETATSHEVLLNTLHQRQESDLNASPNVNPEILELKQKVNSLLEALKIQQETLNELVEHRNQRVELPSPQDQACPEQMVIEPTVSQTSLELRSPTPDSEYVEGYRCKDCDSKFAQIFCFLAVLWQQTKTLRKNSWQTHLQESNIKHDHVYCKPRQEKPKKKLVKVVEEEIDDNPGEIVIGEAEVNLEFTEVIFNEEEIEVSELTEIFDQNKSPEHLSRAIPIIKTSTLTALPLRSRVNPTCPKKNKCIILHDCPNIIVNEKKLTPFFDIECIQVNSLRTITFRANLNNICNTIMDTKPEAIFIHLGYTDLRRRADVDALVKNYDLLLHELERVTDADICATMLKQTHGYVELNYSIKHFNNDIKCLINKRRTTTNGSTQVFIEEEQFVIEGIGSKPSYTQWIYEQIIIPALSHGSVVWSHIIDSRKWATNMLNHVQRSALLLITGAISSTPTCYLEVLTQLPPLDLRIHSSSLKTFLRLNITSSASNGLRDGKLKSHSILLSDQIKKILPPLSLIDIAPASLNLTQSFITIILERSLALVQIPLLHKLDTLVGYTDGSVKNNLAGAGFILYLNSSTISEHFIKLGNTTTIFQAELLAILHLCIHLSNSNHEASELHICIDSKAVLHALSGTITRSHLIMDTLTALNFLSRTFSITLHWVPAHSGIQGNDLADTLANKGSDSPPIGPPPFAPYTHSTLSNILDSYFSRLHYNRILIFRSSSDFHQSNIISFFDRHLDIKQHNRDNTRILTHLFTGCSYLRYFQNKIGNESNSICKKCDEDKETTAHYLTSCPAFSSHRKYYFGDYTIREDTFHLIYSISNIVGFARATKYLDFYEPP